VREPRWGIRTPHRSPPLPCSTRSGMFWVRLCTFRKRGMGVLY
jgi:hypothetical protein